MRSLPALIASAATLMMLALPATAAPPQTALPTGDDAAATGTPVSGTARLPDAADRQALIWLAQPVDSGRLSSRFGIRSDPINKALRQHRGIDIAGSYGTPVHAAADGFVAFAGTAGGYGELVRIEHGAGVETRYGHLSAMQVRPGMVIRRGDVIGAMGSTGRSTGNHVHFEVREDGIAVDPTLPLVRAPSPDCCAAAPPVVLHWRGWHEEVGRLPSAF